MYLANITINLYRNETVVYILYLITALVYVACSEKIELYKRLITSNLWIKKCMKGNFPGHLYNLQWKQGNER